MVTLEVVGLRSGHVISFPLAMVVLDGERYLVSMLGQQAAWVRKFDPASRATALLVVGLVTAVVGAYAAGAVGARNEEAGALVEMLGTLGGAFFLILAAFKMRGSIEHHFTQMEPMNVSLSGVMTFFFTFIYLQYHLTWIAEAKRNSRRGVGTHAQ